MDDQDSSLVTTSGFTHSITENDYFEIDGFAPQNGRFKSDFKQNTEDPIGTGGYGFVFKVINKFDEEEYAVKKVVIKGLITSNYFIFY